MSLVFAAEPRKFYFKWFQKLYPSLRTEKAPFAASEVHLEGTLDEDGVKETVRDKSCLVEIFHSRRITGKV